MAQLMPLPLAVSCFSKIQVGFTFLVQAHPGSPGQRAFKWVCGVWVCLIQSVSRRTLGRPVHCLNASIIQSVTLAGGELRRRRGLPGHLLRNHTHYLYIGGFKGRWGHGCCHGISCVTWSRAVTQPTTFEVVCAQAAIGSSSVIVVVLHRPGSEAVQQKFFDELADVLDRFATYFLPLPTTLKGQHSSSSTARHYHLLPSVAQAGHGLVSESWPAGFVGKSLEHLWGMNQSATESLLYDSRQNHETLP